MIKIVITGEKGGTGKSTLACLLVEYLTYQQKKVQLIDTDPLQTAQTWWENCQSEGRPVLSCPAEYQVIDTAGSSGASLLWINQADILIVPLVLHYADLRIVANWFASLNKTLQKKIYFLPNRWQNTKEQREGLKQLEREIKKVGVGQVLPPLSNRPALYAPFLNGNKENFFTDQKNSQEAQQVLCGIFEKKRKK
ncbi:MAG: ParA-like protein [Mycoplasmataceae bacterium RV_VA103A]|nr:MAG: ParA-like protein [Mycoplasmataceae bacterium RV_VA103A]